MWDSRVFACACPTGPSKNPPRFSLPFWTNVRGSLSPGQHTNIWIQPHWIVNASLWQKTCSVFWEGGWSSIFFAPGYANTPQLFCLLITKFVHTWKEFMSPQNCTEFTSHEILHAIYSSDESTICKHFLHKKKKQCVAYHSISLLLC